MHCVQGTDGAAFHANLRLPPTSIVVSKGQDPGKVRDRTPRDAHPKGNCSSPIYRSGASIISTSQGSRPITASKRTGTAALAAGLTVTVFGDAIAGVDAEAGDSARALAEMREKGARVGSGFVPADRSFGNKFDSSCALLIASATAVVGSSSPTGASRWQAKFRSAFRSGSIGPRSFSALSSSCALNGAESSDDDAFFPCPRATASRTGSQAPCAARPSRRPQARLRRSERRL